MTNVGLYFRAIVFTFLGVYMMYMGSSASIYMMLTGGILLLVAMVIILRPYIIKHLK